MEDRGKAEEVEGEVIAIVGQALAPGATTIGRDVVLLARDAERGDVRAAQPRDDMRRHAVHHRVIGEVGQRMPQRREFPVEHRQNARLGGVEDHVVDAEIAVDHRGCAVILGHFRLEPVDDRIHVLVAPGKLVLAVLARPAPDLSREVIARLAIVAKADRLGIEAVQLGDGLVHRIEDRRALLVRNAGHSRIPEDAPLDHLHHVEPGADHRVIGAQPVDLGHREARRVQCAEHLGLALDRVSALEQLARRLAPQDVAARRGDQLVGRVGLPALELLDLHRPGIVRDIRLQPALDSGLVEGKTLAHRGGAGIGFDNAGHDPSFAFFHSRLIFLARLHLWTSVGPS